MGVYKAEGGKMSDRIFIGIKQTIIHPQWGAPMDFHRISRVEHDLIQNESYVTLQSFYSQAVAENGGSYMSYEVVRISNAFLSDESTLLQAVLDEPSSVFAEGEIVTATEAEK